MSGIEKKMAEYRMQTMRIAEEAQAIERQMDALKRLQVCLEQGFCNARNISVIALNPAHNPLFGIDSLTLQCKDCGCWAHCATHEGPIKWMMEHPSTGEHVTLESFIGASEEEEPAHTVDLTKPPEGDEDE
jgi:hypothetical protein